MGVVIRMISEKEAETKANIKKLKILIDQYIDGDKKFILNKIKKEQSK